MAISELEPERAELTRCCGQGQYHSGQHQAASGYAQQSEGKAAYGELSHIEQVVAGVQPGPQQKAHRRQQGGFPAPAEGEQPTP